MSMHVREMEEQTGMCGRNKTQKVNLLSHKPLSWEQTYSFKKGINNQSPIYFYQHEFQSSKPN